MKKKKLVRSLFLYYNENRTIQHNSRYKGHMKKSHATRCIREALSGDVVAGNIGFGHVA